MTTDMEKQARLPGVAQWLSKGFAAKGLKKSRKVLKKSRKAQKTQKKLYRAQRKAHKAGETTYAPNKGSQLAQLVGSKAKLKTLKKTTRKSHKKFRSKRMRTYGARGLAAMAPIAAAGIGARMARGAGALGGMGARNKTLLMAGGAGVGGALIGGGLSKRGSVEFFMKTAMHGEKGEESEKGMSSKERFMEMIAKKKGKKGKKGKASSMMKKESMPGVMQAGPVPKRAISGSQGIGAYAKPNTGAALAAKTTLPPKRNRPLPTPGASAAPARGASIRPWGTGMKSQGIARSRPATGPALAAKTNLGPKRNVAIGSAGSKGLANTFAKLKR